jgi:hypothetical protein
MITLPPVSAATQHQGTQLVETKTTRSRRSLVMPPIVINPSVLTVAVRPSSASQLVNAGSTWTWVLTAPSSSRAQVVLNSNDTVMAPIAG